LCTSDGVRSSGWHGLLLPIIDEINLYNEKHPENRITIDHIKQKWGTLRFDTSGCPVYIRGMITMAEKESGHICEICGARGKLTEFDGWEKTLCKHHMKARKEANSDYELEKIIYMKAMDKYERSHHTHLKDYKLIKIKKNWYEVKDKVRGKLRVINLEREHERTNFYVKNGKKYEKHKIYVQWIENENKSLHDGYWYVMEGNEKVPFEIVNRKFAEIASVERIFFSFEKEEKK
jgi:hypothetical protein